MDAMNVFVGFNLSLDRTLMSLLVFYLSLDRILNVFVDRYLLLESTLIIIALLIPFRIAALLVLYYTF